MFDAKFVLDATESIEYEHATEFNDEHKEEYATQTLEEVEADRKRSIEKEKQRVHRDQIKASLKKHQSRSRSRQRAHETAAAARIAMKHSSSGDTFHITSNVVQHSLGTYRRACRNERGDQMKHMREHMTKVIAPKMTSRDRRKLWKSLSASKSKFKRKPKIVLQPTWAEKKAFEAAKTNWAQADVLTCLCCGVLESNHDGNYGSGFLPLVPCGHCVLCQHCADVCKRCPSCHNTIDHAFSKFLRPQTPQIKEMNSIMNDIRGARSNNLGLVRRASLARIRDARHVGSTGGGSNKAMLARGKPVKGDRTSRILFDLGSAAVSTGKMSPSDLENLDAVWEASVDKACHEASALEGQTEMLRLFNQLSPRVHDDAGAGAQGAGAQGAGAQDAGAQDAGAQDAGATHPDSDAFCLERKDNTSWIDPRKGMQVVWMYDEHAVILGQHDDNNNNSNRENKELLPYVAEKGHARMERFRHRMNPRIQALEREQFELEVVVRSTERVAEDDVKKQKNEVEQMMSEDHVSHLVRYWSYSLTERESGRVCPDIDVIDDLYNERRRNFVSRYKKNWFNEYQKKSLIQRGVRSALFALRMSELARMGAMLLCYQKSCREKNVGVLRDLDRQMSEEETLPCIRASQISSQHVLCISELLTCCGSVGASTLKQVSLSFSRLEPLGARALAKSVTTLSHLHTLAVHNCQSMDNASSILIEVIADRCPVLEQLNLSNNKMADTLAMNSSLTKLFANGKLVHLDLSKNELTANAGRAIAQGLESDVCFIEVINVSWNHLRREGVTLLLAAARKSNKSLSSIDISYNGFRLEEVNMKMKDSNIIVVAEGTRAPGWGSYVHRHPAPRPQTPPFKKLIVSKKKKKETQQGKKKKKK